VVLPQRESPELVLVPQEPIQQEPLRQELLRQESLQRGVLPRRVSQREVQVVQQPGPLEVPVRSFRRVSF
jgi:hypothetical protein